MPKFYQTPQFKALDLAWRKKLKETGFIDCEDGRENLKSPNRRTQAFTDRENVSLLFDRLEVFLDRYKPQIPGLHLMILVMYSEGVSREEIKSVVQRGRTTVNGIIREYMRKINQADPFAPLCSKGNKKR